MLLRCLDMPILICPVQCEMCIRDRFNMPAAPGTEDRVRQACSVQRDITFLLLFVIRGLSGKGTQRMDSEPYGTLETTAGRKKRGKHKHRNFQSERFAVLLFDPAETGSCDTLYRTRLWPCCSKVRIDAP